MKSAIDQSGSDNEGGSLENPGSSKWFGALGLCLIVLGCIAVAFPYVTTIAAKMALGWLFIFGGAAQLFHAFSTKAWSGFFWNLLVAIAYLIAGGWLAFFPLTGVFTLTFLLAATFIAQGIMEAVMAIRLRPAKGWLWMLISALIALAAGLLILGQLPSSAVWAIGLLAGINMMSSGIAYIAVAGLIKRIG
jgi:uncharacterized membrane protein HdeD (DUF308 family)